MTVMQSALAETRQSDTQKVAVLHISSLVAHVQREHWTEVMAFLKALPDTELPIANLAEGKCVVVLERDSLRTTEAAMDDIKALPGVVAVTLVYHHSEAEDDLAAPLDAG